MPFASSIVRKTSIPLLGTAIASLIALVFARIAAAVSPGPVTAHMIGHVASMGVVAPIAAAVLLRRAVGTSGDCSSGHRAVVEGRLLLHAPPHA